jgi:hypothetical protein
MGNLCLRQNLLQQLNQPLNLLFRIIMHHTHPRHTLGVQSQDLIAQSLRVEMSPAKPVIAHLLRLCNQRLRVHTPDCEAYSRHTVLGVIRRTSQYCNVVARVQEIEQDFLQLAFVLGDTGPCAVEVRRDLRNGLHAFVV